MNCENVSNDENSCKLQQNQVVCMTFETIECFQHTIWIIFQLFLDALNKNWMNKECHGIMWNHEMAINTLTILLWNKQMHLDAINYYISNRKYIYEYQHVCAVSYIKCYFLSLKCNYFDLRYFVSVTFYFTFSYDTISHLVPIQKWR